MQSILKAIVVFLFVLASEPAAAAGFQYLSFPDTENGAVELGIWYPSDGKAVESTLGDIAQTIAVDGPVRGEHLPLVIFSHGGEGRYDDRSDAARMLAEAGFIAVSLTHPGDNYKNVERDILLRLVERPKQISRVLDYLTTAWPERGHVDASKVGFYGFSNGGFTGLVAIGGQPDWTLFTSYCGEHAAEGVCTQGGAKRLSSPAAEATSPSDWQHDTRIKAAVFVSPAYAFAFDPESLKNVQVPVALWGSSGDRVVSFAGNVSYLNAQLPKVKEMHDVKGAGHPSFLRACSDALRLRLPDLCNDSLGFDRKAFQITLNSSVVSFFRRNLSDD
ncbi:hypothetical protein J5277_04860 [Rhizobium sp. 16-449-1b]|uniref:alpha/beta hydrolase family protein n=1 Tax=Rhizobium sp. 16-449-1b TaxID=2819989 RepID=UPI001ADBA720|nr:hypothetical protein [Rhizobium sp. 16-449-1b]MBO9193434.1 hypothetical protein [Rhizobium sp. 16-449-1b]